MVCVLRSCPLLPSAASSAAFARVGGGWGSREAQGSLWEVSEWSVSFVSLLPLLGIGWCLSASLLPTRAICCAAAAAISRALSTATLAVAVRRVPGVIGSVLRVD